MVMYHIYNDIIRVTVVKISLYTTVIRVYVRRYTYFMYSFVRIYVNILIENDVLN